MKLWHDRAASHFLIDQESRSAYVRCFKNALQPGGTLIVATFAQDRPQQCSGRPTMRYTPAILSSNLGLPSGSLKTFTCCQARQACARKIRADSQGYVLRLLFCLHAAVGTGGRVSLRCIFRASWLFSSHPFLLLLHFFLTFFRPRRHDSIDSSVCNLLSEQLVLMGSSQHDHVQFVHVHSEEIDFGVKL